MLVIVDYIDISWYQPSSEKDCYHTPVQMIIALKHFLCSILDRVFPRPFRQGGFVPPICGKTSAGGQSVNGGTHEGGHRPYGGTKSTFIVNDPMSVISIVVVLIFQ